MMYLLGNNSRPAVRDLVFPCPQHQTRPPPSPPGIRKTYKYSCSAQISQKHLIVASFGQTLPEQVSFSAQIHQLPVVLLSIPWMSVDVVNIKDLSNVKTCGATFSHKAPRRFHIAEALACMLKLGFYTTEDDHWEPILVSRKLSPAGTTGNHRSGAELHK